MSQINISFPEIFKQAEIVQSLEKTKEKTQHLQSLYQRKLAILEELKQSLLHQAFTGALTNKSIDTSLTKVL
ncbi:hypothetical protein [Candidatus Nitrosacidococcus sp. I8]|uniref:hypothetical protein n=1 Tax=Candidatus Nitrosacidococcus sp. I8 TaxID=2942908 RepID=UPI002226111A|nr:hypothetical protein [Candidatus Nitrosacidococcus sp. I8]